MPRKRQSAAEYVKAHDEFMRVRLSEMIDHASKANMAWMSARRQIESDPDAALRGLIDAEIEIDIPVRLERSDALKVLRAASNRLGDELPDDPDEDT